MQTFKFKKTKIYAAAANCRVRNVWGNTQAIKTNWGHLKTKILRQMRGTNVDPMPGHLVNIGGKASIKKNHFGT